MNLADRLARLRDYLAENKSSAAVVSKIENLYYFSGFRGDDTLLVITGGKAFLITDFRYAEQAREQAPLFELIVQKDGLYKAAAELIKSLGGGRVAFEGNDLSYNNYAKLQKLLAPVSLDVPLNLDGLRVVKDAEEIALIAKACAIGDAAFADILNFIKPGIREIDVAARLESIMRSLGSEEPSFKTIVASGERGSLPHGIATEKLIVGGEFVTMDYGAVYRGYHSDMTRTICVGRADEKQRRIYDAVLKAQLLGVEKTRAGAGGKAVDLAVRAELKKDDLAQHFGHGLGHSVGLEIHEEPRLSSKSTAESLEVGTVITVEPGVYIAGWGGVRIEDTVLVTSGAARPLTRSDKRLIELPA